MRVDTSAAHRPDLAPLARRANELCRRLDALSAYDAAREGLLRELFGACGANPQVLSGFRCDFGRYIEVGDNFFANWNLTVLDGGGVSIGDDVMIAPNCGIYTAEHPLDAGQRASGFEYARPVRIGNGVWLGGGATVCPGVSIGEGSVIGAGSVVTRDIPAGVVAAGSPCRVIRELGESDKLTDREMRGHLAARA